ncbi:hypothetical protein, partial [Bradyrhizobium sp. SZCCHNRI1005]|uniref:hypothetical protein n=1 Tax=Bradyrhizobium sp. SZCCHNRI1005 TaxID=3057276 RepID=UPI0028F12BD7
LLPGQGLESRSSKRERRRQRAGHRFRSAMAAGMRLGFISMVVVSDDCGRVSAIPRRWLRPGDP